MSPSEPRESDYRVPTPRAPGWTLVATREGTQGWHLIAAAVGGYGSLRTVCGLTGRKIDESQREIICCSACQEAAGSSTP